MVVEEISVKNNSKVINSSVNVSHKPKETALSNSQVYVMVATEDGHFLKLDITSHINKLYL
jgi:hypothetical protein